MAGEGNGNPLQYCCLENPMDSKTPWSLVGYSPWGHKESDTTEQFHFTSLLNGNFAPRGHLPMSGDRHSVLFQLGTVVESSG